MKQWAVPGETESGCFPRREGTALVLEEASAPGGGVGQLLSCVLFLFPLYIWGPLPLVFTIGLKNKAEARNKQKNKNTPRCRLSAALVHRQHQGHVGAHCGERNMAVGQQVGGWCWVFTSRPLHVCLGLGNESRDRKLLIGGSERSGTENDGESQVVEPGFPLWRMPISSPSTQGEAHQLGTRLWFLLPFHITNQGNTAHRRHYKNNNNKRLQNESTIPCTAGFMALTSQMFNNNLYFQSTSFTYVVDFDVNNLRNWKINVNTTFDLKLGITIKQ